MFRQLLTIVTMFAVQLLPLPAAAQDPTVALAPGRQGDGMTGSPARDEAAHRASAASAPSLTQGEPPRPRPCGQAGCAIESAGGDFRLQIGLLVHFDGRFGLNDSGNAVVDAFAFRRLRPYLRGRFARRFEFSVNPDFAGGSLVVQDAYVDTVFAPALRIRAGKGKTPFGLERLHAASNLLFFSRALPTALVPNRDVGVQLLGDGLGGVLGYLAGVMNGVPDGGSADVDAGDGKDLAGRVIVRPFIRTTASPFKGLGMAISGSRGRQIGAAALPAFRTQSLDQPYFAYSGASADGVRTRYSPQVFYYHRAFGGFAEYVRTRTPIRKGDVREDVAHEAWQIAASFVLTGEGATDAGVGIRPRSNFEPGNGHLGAFQVAARYHTLRVDGQAQALGFAARGSSQGADAWTVGLNWYLTGNFRYTFNFERTVFDDDADGARKAENALVFRTQVHF